MSGEGKSLPSWRDASDDLVTQCDNPDGDVWILGDEAARVIGQAVVQRQGQPWGGPMQGGRRRPCGCRGGG